MLYPKSLFPAALYPPPLYPPALEVTDPPDPGDGTARPPRTRWWPGLRTRPLPRPTIRPRVRAR